MRREILLLSDSHYYSDELILKHASEVNEVWHAGDWGDLRLFDELEKLSTVRGVYGNIDGALVRKVCPKELFFECEGLKVFMIHIGGYPGRYTKGVKETLERLKPDLFISGHSHICKIVKDKALNLLHINPGAIGNKGFHKVRTMVRFAIEEGEIQELRVLEYEKNYKN